MAALLSYDQNNISFNTLLEVIEKSGKEFDTEVIKKAYDLASSAHENQKRLSGEPYIIHPLNVACIVVELGLDTEAVAAALMHDVVEDTQWTLQQVQKMFGKQIADLIDGLTKIDKIPFSSRE